MLCKDFPGWVRGGGGKKLEIRLSSAQLQLGLGLSLAIGITVKSLRVKQLDIADPKLEQLAAIGMEDQTTK